MLFNGVVSNIEVLMGRTAKPSGGGPQSTLLLGVHRQRVSLTGSTAQKWTWKRRPVQPASSYKGEFARSTTQNEGRAAGAVDNTNNNNDNNINKWTGAGQ